MDKQEYKGACYLSPTEAQSPHQAYFDKIRQLLSGSYPSSLR